MNNEYKEADTTQLITWITDALPRHTGLVLVDNGLTVTICQYIQTTTQLEGGCWCTPQGDKYLYGVFRWAELPTSCKKAVTPDWSIMLPIN